MNGALYFYHQNEEHCHMSNFYMSRFSDEQGVAFLCTEQYLMKKKQELFDPENERLAENIMNSRYPQNIKEFGRQVNNFSEEVWRENRTDIMEAGLRMKYMQNDDIGELLLNTGSCPLYEAAANDRIWGIGFNKHTLMTSIPPIAVEAYGLNLLGEALQKIRAELKRDQMTGGRPIEECASKESGGDHTASEVNPAGDELGEEE